MSRNLAVLLTSRNPIAPDDDARAVIIFGDEAVRDGLIIERQGGASNEDEMSARLDRLSSSLSQNAPVTRRDLWRARLKRHTAEEPDALLVAASSHAAVAEPVAMAVVKTEVFVAEIPQVTTVSRGMTVGDKLRAKRTKAGDYATAADFAVNVDSDEDYVLVGAKGGVTKRRYPEEKLSKSRLARLAHSYGGMSDAAGLAMDDDIIIDAADGTIDYNALSDAVLNIDLYSGEGDWMIAGKRPLEEDEGTATQRNPPPGFSKGWQPRQAPTTSVRPPPPTAVSNVNKPREAAMTPKELADTLASLAINLSFGDDDDDGMSKYLTGAKGKYSKSGDDDDDYNNDRRRTALDLADAAINLDSDVELSRLVAGRKYGGSDSDWDLLTSTVVNAESLVGAKKDCKTSADYLVRGMFDNDPDKTDGMNQHKSREDIEAQLDSIFPRASISTTTLSPITMSGSESLAKARGELTAAAQKYTLYEKARQVIQEAHRRAVADKDDKFRAKVTAMSNAKLIELAGQYGYREGASRAEVLEAHVRKVKHLEGAATIPLF